MGSRLIQYKGFLTTEKVAAGMTAAGQNAKRLADDAQLLFEAERSIPCRVVARGIRQAQHPARNVDRDY
jgi:hypothetical protein